MSADTPAVRPILFSTPMVRALREGRKTQTRRLRWKGDVPTRWCRVKRGDLLWVREAFWWSHAQIPGVTHETPQLVYRATVEPEVAKLPGVGPWKPAIHMPRSLSRMTLEVEDVRGERLREISEEDARAEGAASAMPASSRFCNHDGRWIAGQCRDCAFAEPTEPLWGGRRLDGCPYLLGDERDEAIHLSGGCNSFALRSAPEPARFEFAWLWQRLHGHRASCAWTDNPEVVVLTFAVHERNVDELLRERAKETA